MKLRNLLAATFAIFPWIASGGEQPALGFHLYYGNAPEELAQLKSQCEPGAIAVIDTRVLKQPALKELQTDTKASGARVLAYLSIGEVHATEIESLRKFLSEQADPVTVESITIDRNDTFNSYRIDVFSEPFQQWIHQKAREVLASGVDGLFLDTVDTVDTYITREDWDLKRRAESVAAMVGLIRSFRREHPSCFILQNGGLNIIGDQVFIGNESGVLEPALALRKPHPENPHGILWENAFAGSGAWSKGRLEELQKIRGAGHTQVFALGYEAAFAKPSRLFERCRKNRFIGAWAKSSEVLHEAAVIPMTADTDPTGSGR